MHALSDRTFDRIAALMHATIGLSLTANKKPLVASRLSGRLQQLGMRGYDDYVALIEGADTAARDEATVAGEFQMAVDLLTTNETYFFREPAHFDLLEQVLAREHPRRVAAWSAASSFGDEAYSIAMVLSDLQAQGRIGEDWSVLGTDISERVLRTAAAGVYPAERLRAVPPARLKRHCLRGEGAAEGLAQVQPRLRERVRFGFLNLCEPLDPPGPFDVVFLRNVLIYFDPPTKQRVVEAVLAHLRPGGLFFLGTAEGRVPGQPPLERLAPGAYRKLAA